MLQKSKSKIYWVLVGYLFQTTRLNGFWFIAWLDFLKVRVNKFFEIFETFKNFLNMKTYETFKIFEILTVMNFFEIYEIL